MATRVVEGKKPYTGGEAIDIDQNKVISLKLRDENNLIIYDSGDDEIYVDLQLPDGITPTDAFPVGVTTGRAVVADGWDKAGTIICAKTTSGDNIKLLYADDGTLWIDNGTGTFKQIYFKADVDSLLLALRNYIDGELAKKQNGVVGATAPSNPSEGDLWYDTTNSAMKVWDGTAWQSVGTGGGGSDIVYATQAEYNTLLPGALTDDKHYFIYTPDSPTPPSPGWQPGANTIAYRKLDGDLTDEMGNYDGTIVGSSTVINYTSLPGDNNIQCAEIYSNGRDDGIALPTSIDNEIFANNVDFTFGGFINMPTVGSAEEMLYMEAGTGLVISFGIRNGNFYTEASGQGSWNTTVNLSANTWYSVIWTYESSTYTWKYYVNGNLIDTVTKSQNYSTSSGTQKAYLVRINDYTIMSNLVIEKNTAWTQQEAKLFHDTFKSLYGIS